MSKLKLSLVIAGALLSQAAAAQSPQLGAGQVLGNTTAAQRNAQASDFRAILERNFGAPANVGCVINRGASIFSCTRFPVLGNAGGATGSLGFTGLTSGVMTLKPNDIAGTGQLTLPNTAGTLAAGASTPLVLNATTGNLTCPTCATSSGGGAITGTAPIVVSGAGNVSVTGSALTSANDTNVTVTLGGTPASALLAASSLTLGWTGTLSYARGGFGAAITASNGGIFYSNATNAALLAGNATARLPLLSGASTTPVWGAYTLPASVTSGGVACFTSTTVEASSALLTANAITLGGGAGVCPSPMASLGTTTTVLHGNAAGAPTWGSVNLAADVSGTLPSSSVTAHNLATSGNGGVTGLLPLANIATGIQDTSLGYWGSTAVSALAIPNCANSLTYSTSTHTYGCNASAGTGTVTSVAAGSGLSASPSPIVSSGTISLSAARLKTPTRCIIMTTAATTCFGGQAFANNGTFTPDPDAIWMRVRAIGGGASGIATGTSPGTPTGGGNTTFGGLTAGGGGAGTTGAGGTATGFNLIGVNGGATSLASAGISSTGAQGTPSCLGGAGSSAFNSPGGAGSPGTGSGGGGGWFSGTGNSSQGGAAGACGEHLYPAPLSATYSYTVGTGGSAPAAGASGMAGGAGGSGQIIVEMGYN